MYVSVPGIILSIKPKTIAYMTQLTSLNTRVLHHGYIYRSSAYFKSRYNFEYQTRNYSGYMTQLTSLNACALHHGYIYRISVYFKSRYNSEYETRNYSAYMTQLPSLNICVLHHSYIYRISVYFSSMYNSGYQTKNYCIYDPVNVSKYLGITPYLDIQNFCMFHFQIQF